MAIVVDIAVGRLAKLSTEPPPATKLEAPNDCVDVDTVYEKTLLYGAEEVETDVT